MFRNIKQFGLALALLIVPLSGTWSLEVHGSVKLNKYIRVESTPESVRLETSVVKFRSKADAGLEVDLVGVIHIGEADYYEKINTVLEQYDAVLYEWVGPKDSLPKVEIYPAVARALKLVSQTKIVRYDRKTFVHADMTEEELFTALKLPAIKLPESDPALDPTAIMLRSKGYRQARWDVAREVSQESSFTTHPVIILDRNQVALRALESEIAKGKKKIAIFYGAAHNPDFERHLTDRFNMTPVSTDWLRVWDLNPR